MNNEPTMPDRQTMKLISLLTLAFLCFLAYYSISQFVSLEAKLWLIIYGFLLGTFLIFVFLIKEIISYYYSTDKGKLTVWMGIFIIIGGLIHSILLGNLPQAINYIVITIGLLLITYYHPKK